MKIFYDAEFLEDGRTIELISIGMVAEDGREVYAVNEAIGKDPLYDRIRGHEWLMANVVPHLPLSTRYNGEKSHSQPDPKNTHPRRLGHFNLAMDDNRIMPIRMIRNVVREFVLTTPDVELWAWYGAYDHVVLAQLFGRMIDLPQGFPMWTHEMQQELDRAGIDAPEQSGDLHNALADARHLVELDRLVRAAGTSTDEAKRRCPECEDTDPACRTCHPAEPLDWHYGPTPDDQEPGNRWHTGCGGEVLSIDGGDICTKCHAQDEETNDAR